MYYAKLRLSSLHWELLSCGPGGRKNHGRNRKLYDTEDPLNRGQEARLLHPHILSHPPARASDALLRHPSW